jgi:hypothetical protein
MVSRPRTKERKTGMTKKHFKALAEALKAAKPEGQGLAELKIWERTCKEIADSVCAPANPRFDRYRFLCACGL